MRTLTIKRSKWVRGILNGDSRLKNDAGNMCCLGFEARACGFPHRALVEAGTPEDMLGTTKGLTEKEMMKRAPHLFSWINEPLATIRAGKMLTDSEFVNEAININDDCQLSEQDREAKLYNLFMEQGIELEFVD